MNENKAQIRLRVKEVIEEKGTTQYAVANAIGMAHSTMSRIATNQTVSIHFDLLAKLCDHLECEPGDLFEYTPSKKRKKSKSD